jgi:hypothetical protein
VSVPAIVYSIVELRDPFAFAVTESERNLSSEEGFIREEIHRRFGKEALVGDATDDLFPEVAPELHGTYEAAVTKATLKVRQRGQRRLLGFASLAIVSLLMFAYASRRGTN